MGIAFNKMSKIMLQIIYIFLLQIVLELEEKLAQPSAGYLVLMRLKHVHVMMLKLA